MLERKISRQAWSAKTTIIVTSSSGPIAVFARNILRVDPRTLATRFYSFPLVKRMFVPLKTKELPFRERIVCHKLNHKTLSSPRNAKRLAGAWQRLSRRRLMYRRHMRNMGRDSRIAFTNALTTCAERLLKGEWDRGPSRLRYRSLPRLKHHLDPPGRQGLGPSNLLHATSAGTPAYPPLP